jgi:hypothetical protein
MREKEKEVVDMRFVRKRKIETKPIKNKSELIMGT